MQHAAWVIPPLALAAVLGLSASAKWGKGTTLHTIIRNLRLPAWVLPTWLAPAVPASEGALALGLLTPWQPVFAVAAVGTTVLMVVYWGLIAHGLTLEPRPTCGCFGRVGDHRISPRTLVRNTLLVGAAVSATTLAVSGRTVWSLLSGSGTGELLWLALAAAACAVTGLVVGRAEASTPFTMPEMPAAHEPSDSDDVDYVRTPVPSSLLHDPDAGPVTLLELTRDRAQLLVFVNCHCVSTGEVSHAIEGWQARLDLLDVRLVFAVPIQPELVKNPLPPGTLVDHAGLTWTALALREPSPSAVLLGTDGLLAGGPVSGLHALVEFVDDIEDSLRAASLDPERSLEPTGPDERQLTSDR